VKILVADDEAVSRRLLESSLSRWGFEVIAVSDGTQASRILLAPNAPNLALLDWMMPGLDGLQLCQKIRTSKPEPYTYIFLLTGKCEQEDVIRGLEAGADDYITKPFDPSELKVRLRTGKRILFLQEQLIGAREALRHQATHDELTKILNRSAIFEILSQELGRTQRESGSLGVVLADLDHFKAVNDTYGHAAGDEVLRMTSQVMRESTRRYDSVGRYGGEEFLIVLPGCDASNAVSHAERLKSAVSQISLDVGSGTIRPTVSMGVAVADKFHPSTAIDLVQLADAALYRAKRNGRNRVELATDTVLLAT
jgi:diguanylate cyclase (GGDEF)-like protein